MDPFATPSDVEAIWRPLTGAELNVVATRLVDASQMVRDEVPLVGGLDVDERIEAGTLKVETVRQVVVAMVERLSVVQRFVRQQSTAVDDGSQSVTIDSSVSAGEMFISAREMRRLSGSRNRNGQQAYMVPSVPLTFGCSPWT